MTRGFFICPFLLWLSATTAFGTYSPPTTKSYRSPVDATERSRLLRSPGVPDSLIQAETLIEGDTEIPSTSPAEYKFIKKALLENVMFSNLPNEAFDRLIYAFERFTPKKGDVIVTQGDFCDGDYVYLVAEGYCTVIVDGKVVPEPYGKLKPKAIFGELGIMYNQTRSATIKAMSDNVVLFRVNAETFQSLRNHFPSNDNPELLREIDEAINQVSGTKSLYGGDIIRTYKPSRRWLWSRWTGTVFQHNYKTVGFNMLGSLLFIVSVRIMTDPTWNFGLIPDKSHHFIQRLDIIRKIWSYQMSLTTFILTFFLQRAYSFWQEVYDVTRRIQGRLNDFHLLLATGAKRNPDGTYTRESEKLMDDIGVSSRMLHALFWASCARRFSVLRTNKGLERMASRGLMTFKQLQVLKNLDLPDNQRHNACLEWMMIRAWQGIDDGTLRTEPSFSQSLMDQMCQIRATYGTIGDKLACRMPLPYTHLVQILVDSFIALSPVALYPDLGAYSIFSVGVLTLFYTGLLDLAKVFLDPLDNEDFTKNSIDMDLGVLIRESNGGSTRWKNAGANLPFTIASRPLRPPTTRAPKPEKEAIKLDGIN